VKAFNGKQKTGKIFVISGPSGSGKTTLLTSLTHDQALAGKLAKSRSLTTRPRRSAERQGREYFFVSPSQFQQLLKAKKILEWTRYLGYYYGTPKEALEKRIQSGKHIGLCLDLKGARILKKLYPNNTVTIFVLPPSLGVLKERIQNRCQKTQKQEITQRLALARQELKAAREFDHCVLNSKLNIALKELKTIIGQAIKHSTS